MKNKKSLILSVVCLLVGIAVLFYPALNNVIFVSQQNKVIDNYNKQIEELDSEEIANMKEEAKKYNDTLTKTASSDVVDNSEVVSGNMSYAELMAVNNDQIGYLVIPKISLNQPIFHTTEENEEEVLEKGIGHMEHTSFPIGGDSTHAVLSGHSGIPGMMLFTDLEDVVVGDKFYIKALDETIAYEIDQIKTVLPNDVSEIQIVNGEDYVTLLTCTPYGVNTHRLLVRGTRVPYNGEIDEKEEKPTEEKVEATLDEDGEDLRTYSMKFILYYVITPAIISCIMIALLVIICKKRREKREKNSTEK